MVEQPPLVRGVVSMSVDLRRRLRDGPIPEGAFTSPLHDERVAAALGVALGVCFTVCFVTGLISHLLQHPQSWFHWPARPIGSYRVTQGVHLMTGIASIPLLLVKLWVVYPKLYEWPPARGVAHAVERLSLLPLVGGSLFLLFTGVINIAYWYSPMPFYFPAAHYWVAWLTIGALIAHIGAKATQTATVLRQGSSRVDVVAPEAPARPAGAGLTRRQLLYVAGGGSALLLGAVAGETVPALERLAVLAPRRSRTGPQGVPINRSAADAGVHDAALDPAFRLVLDRGHGAGELGWTLDELRSMPQRRAGLPIACVEGWSASAEWEGVQVRHLLGLAGLPADTELRFESVEQRGAYRMSVLDADHVADPDTLLAMRLHGEPLDLDHGYPLRLIAPNRPGVLQTKWVSRVVVV